MGEIGNTPKNRRNRRKRHKGKTGCDILVIRIDRTGKLNNSKPCNECIQMLKKYNINRVYYSNSEGEIVCEKVCQITTDHMSTGYQAIENLRRYGIYSCRVDITMINKEK